MNAYENLITAAAGLLGTVRGLGAAFDGELKPEAEKILLNGKRVLNVAQLLIQIKALALLSTSSQQEIVMLLEMDLPEPSL